MRSLPATHDGQKDRVLLLGCGFVADLYARSLASFPGITVAGVFDIDAARLGRFCSYWDYPACASLDDLLAAAPGALVMNLTNPRAHYATTRACLEAGHPVYSEKPLATTMQDARALHALAAERGLALGSAPCSALGEAAQTLGHALRHGTAGPPPRHLCRTGRRVCAAGRLWQMAVGIRRAMAV